MVLAFLFSVAFAMFPSIDAPAKTGQRAPGDAAVVIGNADYFVLTDVVYADADARAFKSFLLYTRGVPSDRIALFDAGANREKIVAAVKEAGAKVSRGGTLWIYFAGHGAAATTERMLPGNGAASATTTERMLLGNDATADVESFEARGVKVSELERLGSAGGGHVTLVIDACYGGVGRDGKAVCAGCRSGVPHGYGAPAAGRSEWAAAGPNEFSGPLHAAGHGAFTYFAVGALRGWADGEIDGVRDGVVTAEEASVYVEGALGAAQVRGQHPKWIGEATAELSRGVNERAPSFEEDAPPPPPPDPRLDVAAKLAEQACEDSARTKGASQRASKLDAKERSTRSQATTDWRALDLGACLEVRDAAFREACAGKADAFVATALKPVTLAAAAERVETACGGREPVFAAESRAVAVPEVAEARALAVRLRAAAVTAAAAIAAPGAVTGADVRSPTLGLLKWIPAGTFTMGSAKGVGEADERPAHRVTLSQGFHLMETEVTQGMWIGENPSAFAACGATCPVEKVSWTDAIAFANAVSKREGLREVYRSDGSVDPSANGYRLPTEAEWEYAARGGKTNVYAGSDEATDVGWIAANSGGKTHAACGKRRNGYGLCDMTGNVWEWTGDWYYGPYPSPPQDGSERVIRGGTWNVDASNARVAYRSNTPPASRRYTVGFRLSRSSIGP